MFPPLRLYTSQPSHFMTSVAPGAKDCNWPPWRVSSRLLATLKRLVGAKSHVGLMMLDLFRGSQRVEPAPPGPPSAKRSRRRLGFFVPSVARREPLEGAPTAGTVVVPRAAAAGLRGTKRGLGSDIQWASDSKGEVEEAEEKAMEVEDPEPPLGTAGVHRSGGGGGGGGGAPGDQDAMADDGSGSDGEDGWAEAPMGSLFDRLVCLSLHPMYRSSARYMRNLYTILGDVADQMSGYGARQAALDEAALRDFILVRRREGWG